MADKLIEIVAGPNGSGKSTFAESYILGTKKSSVFLNPDIIAAGIAPLDSEKASFQAGRVLISEVKDRIKAGTSFAFESTLSGRTWITILKEAKSRGFKIVVYFLYLDSVEENQKRIETRVKWGGHLVPAEAVVRRYPRCFANFWNEYRQLCDHWFLFNNSTSIPRLLVNKVSFDSSPIEERRIVADKFLRGDLL